MLDWLFNLMSEKPKNKQGDYLPYVFGPIDKIPVKVTNKYCLHPEFLKELTDCNIQFFDTTTGKILWSDNG